ncbi:ABC transporter permease [Paenibacillus lutrae]|uniref:ABC transporter permease subunit n=1 Tax=Paenibacillus lutrae TaxID=2078573 RepID=A0A7X3FH58_9BACL|nr:ABC transporter permease [Paenibacillus lutrae]MVO99403.1 ABC transporter permease subunit [Paenibacillus lutrae]
MKFFSLIQNEIMKLASKRSTWIFYVFIVLISLFLGIPIKIWIQSYIGNYVSFSSTVIMVCSLFITLFALVLGAQTVTEEYKDGTIKQLLIRPASRTSILMAKYISCLLTALLAYVLLFISSIAVGAVLFGTEPLAEQEFIVHLKSVLYALPDLIFMYTLAFVIGTVFRSSALAITIAVVMNMAGSVFAVLQYDWAKYLIFNNTNWTMYDPNPHVSEGLSPPFPGMTFGFSFTIYLAYWIILMGITIYIFRKRDIA